MRAFRLLLLHEVRVLLLSPGTYVAAFIFLLVMGFALQSVLDGYAATAQEDPVTVPLFSAFFLPALFLVPILTMRTLADERRSGTLESLLTTPVSAGAVVLSKFTAAWAFYFGLWLLILPPIAYAASAGGESRLFEAGPVLGALLFAGGSGLLFVALGILASALCSSQLVAAILGFVLVFILTIGSRYGADWVALQQEAPAWAAAALDHLQFFNHADTLARGIVDSRPLLLYVTGAAAALYLAVLAVEARPARR